MLLTILRMEDHKILKSWFRTEQTLPPGVIEGEGFLEGGVGHKNDVLMEAVSFIYGLFLVYGNLFLLKFYLLPW